MIKPGVGHRPRLFDSARESLFWAPGRLGGRADGRHRRPARVLKRQGGSVPFERNILALTQMVFGRSCLRCVFEPAPPDAPRGSVLASDRPVFQRDTSRLTLRQKRSKPLLEGLDSWMKIAPTEVLPQGPLAKAIGYARNHWVAGCCFWEDDRLELTNNSAKRALRPRSDPGEMKSLRAGAEGATGGLPRVNDSFRLHALGPDGATFQLKRHTPISLLPKTPGDRGPRNVGIEGPGSGAKRLKPPESPARSPSLCGAALPLWSRG